MAGLSGGFKKQLWTSRALRPGDSSAPPPEFKKSGGTRSPTKGGLHSSTAPMKTEMQHFESKHGFIGGFGRTGMSEES